LLRPISVSIDAEALENARNGFHRAFAHGPLAVMISTQRFHRR
jgi:hypothetical protein